MSRLILLVFAIMSFAGCGKEAHQPAQPGQSAQCIVPGSPSAVASIASQNSANSDANGDQSHSENLMEEDDISIGLTSVEDALSPVRHRSTSWQRALAKEYRKAGLQPNQRLSSSALVERFAKKWSESFDVSSLPEWTLGEESLLSMFRFARDERRYVDSARPDFYRRALWLYPYNGCFVRAAHVAQSFERRNFPRPGKVFAFGDLSLKTPYDPRGWVYWSYHVAAAFRIGNTAVVIDPSVDPTRVLTLEEWLTAIADDMNEVRVATCDTYAYTPLNPCFSGKASQERSTVSHLKLYLPDEWKRLKQARFDVEKVLGAEPPWLEIEEADQPDEEPATPPVCL